MADDTTKIEMTANAEESKITSPAPATPYQPTISQSAISDIEQEREAPRAPLPPAPPAAPSMPTPPPAPPPFQRAAAPASIAALPPLPGPIYAPIPPRAPLPPPVPAKKPVAPAAPEWGAAPATAPALVISDAPPSETGAIQTPSASTTLNTGVTAPPTIVTGEDVGLKQNISKILEEVKMPERRDVAGATQNPALAQSSIINTPYRATTQLDTAAPTTDVPSALELSVAQNKITAKPEEGSVAIPRSSVMSLHTMKTDLQDVVHHDKISVVRAVSMESDAHKSAAAPTAFIPPAPKKRGGAFFTFIATVILLTLGAGALYAVYYLETAGPAEAPTTVGLIFTEQRFALPIEAQSAAALKQQIAAIMVSSPPGGNTIVGVIPTISEGGENALPRPATIAEFLAALGARPTDEFTRALGDEFFFGIHYADAPSPVFIVPVTSFNNAFAGMLAWEKTINADLGGLFTYVPPYKTVLVPALQSATSTASSTPETAATTTEVQMVETRESIERTFEDLVMRNYDVRALKDDSGAIVLYYSFPTQNTLVISASPYTFSEVLERLQAARKL